MTDQDRWRQEVLDRLDEIRDRLPPPVKQPERDDHLITEPRRPGQGEQTPKEVG